MIACLYGSRPVHIPNSTQVQTMQTPQVVTIKPAQTPKLPDGVELTVSELQEMAARQQQQIESQQQMLVAKEQRVKYLKQQEQRSHQLSTENERLQRLRERVETQEMKLQKLRALRGQVDQQKINNSNLTSELESIRSLFNSKEKELSLAVAKVEQLTKQLEELRKGRINSVNGGDGQTVNTAAAIELDKLRRELLYRNKLNDQQNNKLVQQREILSQKSEEMIIIDKRIAELQQRLHRKRLHNQQLTNQINAANTVKQAQLRANNKNNRVRPFSSNVAAVEPYQHTPISEADLIESSNGVGGVDSQDQQRTLDDLHAKLNGEMEELSEFQSNKNDPKYQTLPYNTKFTAKYGNSNNNNKSIEAEEQMNSVLSTNGNNRDMSEDSQSIGSLNSPNGQPSSSSPSSSSSSWAPQTVHSIPTYTPPKAHATAVSKGKKQSNVNYENANVKNTQPSVNNSPSQRYIYNSAYPGRQLSSDGNVVTVSNSVPAGVFSSSNAQNLYASNQVPINKVNNLAAPPYIPPPTTNITLKLHNSPNNNEKSSIVSQMQSSSTSNVVQVKGPSLQLVSSSRVNASRPSTIYQTSSTRILPVTPHTLGTTPQGILCEVAEAEKLENQRGSSQQLTSVVVISSNESALSTNSTTTTAASDSTPGVPKPSLPPKPCVLQKPLLPPRQLIHGSSERLSQQEQSSEITSENESSLANQRYDNKFNSSPKTSGTDQQLESSDAKIDSAADQTHNILPSNKEIDLNSAPTQKKQIISKLPIKPKPLTIKKQTGVEPPKLRSNGSSHINSSAKKLNDGSSITINNLWSSNSNSINNNRKVESSSVKTQQMIRDVGNENMDERTVIDMEGDEVDRSSGPSMLEAYMDNANHEKLTGINKYQSVIVSRMGYPLDREKRKPFVDSADSQSTADSNEHNSGNEHVGMVSDHHHHRIDVQFRPGPVGATVEENNNYEEGGFQNKSKDTDISPDICNEDDADKDSSSGSSNDNSGGVSRRIKKGNLKSHNSVKITRRVSFDPLALLLDAALEGELELVKKTTLEVPNPSAANDEGITALHNAICAGHYEIVKFLVEFGCDVNSQDSDGWTPLHCAASCNNLPMVKFLVEHGACIFATTLSDHETAAEKCEEDEEGFDGCTEFLYSVQEKLGILNNGLVYALYDYQAHNSDELDFKNGDVITVLRKGDEYEREWWWSKVKDQEGYIPRNLLGLFPRVPPCNEH